MSSSGSDGLDVHSEELALRIGLERSKVEITGSSGSGATPQLPRRRSEDAGAGSSQPRRSSIKTTQSTPAPARCLTLPAAPPRGKHWILVLAHSKIEGARRPS
ncbi:hypothetical protein D1007_02467 [Hordeum vulgare]|nr:hypothetical protein D1007_02467 [Hordeum vulgare]